jgi:hypothetical protein
VHPPPKISLLSRLDDPNRGQARLSTGVQLPPTAKDCIDGAVLAMVGDQVIARHGNIAERGMQRGMTEQLLTGEGVAAPWR